MATALTDIALYLHRLGHDRAPPPTLETLRALQQRHTATFPFETLSTLLHLPVPLDLPASSTSCCTKAAAATATNSTAFSWRCCNTFGFDHAA